MTSARKHRIARSFNAASGYDGAARVQRIVADRLARRIASASAQSGPRRILEVGCGTGFLTQRLRALFPAAQIVATDIAPDMIRRARAKLGEGPNLAFHVMDAEKPDLDGPFDLICSSMAMQWFSDRQMAMQTLCALLAPDGTMAFTTLCSGSFTQWRGYYAALNIECPMPEHPDPQTLEREWPLSGRGAWTCETIVDMPRSALSFVRELRAIGAGTPRPGHVPASLRHVLEAARRDAVFSANYNVAFGIFRRARHSGVFVTGTDTGVGKTVVSAVLARAWHASYWKPLQSGIADEPADTASVATLAALSPDRLHPPAGVYAASLSPEDAAACEGKVIDPDLIVLPKEDSGRPIVVEGAGGVMVPISAGFLMLDLMERLRLPVVLVARSTLGTINHTLLSLAVLRQRDIPVMGVILNGPDNPYARSAIERHGQVRILAEFPTLDVVSSDTVEQLARMVPDWKEACAFSTGGPAPQGIPESQPCPQG
ncbi:dethiobiotin synthase [Novacetimonas pomaceti]|uniref:ATP-dependent dethiobiotin synthetase BioD n=1 Tax=Novacetimonas pomaceti TaxID=2021998 RepID=A0A318QE63_9PROT|nr:dethiobiotin synthase [Novacetimonas pomaceti]PYD75811.1 dethiobiotin synthase [Novacetimonas pomaceti]